MIAITNEDAITLLASLADASVDMVCIDPPYTDGKGKDVLQKHKIQTVLDIEKLTKEHFRVLKNDSFYCVFGLMPTIIAWYNQAINAGFKYKAHIIWNKKHGNVRQNNQLENIIENIFIFRKGDPIFIKIKDSYEAQTRMNIENGAYIDSVFRTVSYWKGIAQGKNLKSSVLQTQKANDKIYVRGKPYEKTQTLGLEELNIKNIWAYSPHNKKHRNATTGQIKHPTVKPIPLIERLIELCTGENAIVLDSFLGSGTTALACQNLNRDFVGCEIDKDYYEICLKRIEKNINLFT